MTKGKHASGPTGALIRDLAVMAFLFVAAGTLAFGFIWWLQGRGSTPEPPSTTSTVLSSGESTGTTPATTSPPPPTSALVTTTTQPPVRPPSEVQVLVLNAVGRAGIAGSLTDALAAAGYETLPPDNYSGTLEVSKVWFSEGFNAEAHELAAFVPDADVELNPETAAAADIVVVLGPTYDG